MFDGFGEEYRVQIDLDHDAGGAWGTANYAELGGAPVVDRSPGVVSAEFPDRSKSVIGSRRSKIRSPSLALEVFVKPGDPAFDRLREAADDATNDGTEIVRLLICEGDFAEAGNTTWEGDWVVTEAPAPGSAFGEGSTIAYTLRHAADSPNAPVKGVTT